MHLLKISKFIGENVELQKRSIQEFMIWPNGTEPRNGQRWTSQTERHKKKINRRTKEKHLFLVSSQDRQIWCAIKIFWIKNIFTNFELTKRLRVISNINISRRKTNKYRPSSNSFFECYVINKSNFRLWFLFFFHGMYHCSG